MQLANTLQLSSVSCAWTLQHVTAGAGVKPTTVGLVDYPCYLLHHNCPKAKFFFYQFPIECSKKGI